MLNSIILLGGFVSAFGLGAISPNQEKQDNVQFRLENHKSVQYNDDDYEITLTVAELNNYAWDNLASYLNDDVLKKPNVTINDITYNGVVYTPDTYFSGVYLRSTNSTNYLGLYTLSGNTNVFLCNTNVYAEDTFDYGIVISVKQAYYDDFKQAIELDIQANQPTDYSPILGDIVSLLVGGITSFAGGLGAGVSALVGDIFINNGSLSVFGYMVVIFAGIALAIGLSRWVMNFLTSLGRKK